MSRLDHGPSITAV